MRPDRSLQAFCLETIRASVDTGRGCPMKILDLFSLEGMVAVVTGGASGFGRQIVTALAGAGARVFMTSRDPGHAEASAEAQRSAGFDVTALALDLSRESSVLALRDEVVSRAERVDVLVNNAVARPMKKGWDDEATLFDESMHVNATGLFVATRAFGEVMKKQSSGSIINIGSMMGMVGVEPANYDGTSMSGWSPDYFFHKGGMINFTRFCASYFGRDNIRVNCISPGGLENAAAQPEAFVKNYSARTQLGRLADESDLQGAVVFLASNASRYITGVNLPVDGGYTAK